MELESLRRFCLSFLHATEDMPWPDDLCFKVGGKIFAGISLSTVPKGITLKCNPETFAELIERECIGPAPYVGRYKWVRLEGLDVMRDGELKDLIRQSYSMVAAKTPTARKTGKAAKKKKGRRQ